MKNNVIIAVSALFEDISLRTWGVHDQSWVNVKKFENVKTNFVLFHEGRNKVYHFLHWSNFFLCLWTMSVSAQIIFLKGLAYRPVDDQVVWCSSSSLNVIRILERYIFWRETRLGETGGQRFANLVPGDDPERVVGPGGHAHFEGRVGGGNDV